MMADREAEMIIRRVPLFCEVLWGCLELFPANHDYWVTKAIEFFACAHDVYHPIRRSLDQESPADISTMLVKRQVLGQQHFRAVYSSIIDFFLKKGWEIEAWRWLQKRRGRVLLDLLEEHSMSHVYISSLFSGNTEISAMFRKERQLVVDLARAQGEAKQSCRIALAEHRARLRGDPSLTDIFDDTKGETVHEPGLMSDIWSTTRWLPGDANIVLVDWFIATDETIYLVAYPKDLGNLSEDQQTMDATVGVYKVHITVSSIRAWREESMRFPRDGEKPLEERLDLISKLKPLIAPLEELSVPGDLIVFTAPDILEGLPVHAIPLNGRRPLITRNLVVYSPSISLYRKCLHRARVRVVPATLDRASFIGAYEGEGGSEQERHAIYRSVNELSRKFNGTVAWGHRATSMMMTVLLLISPWVHFHGHAHMQEADPMQQGLVLSGVTEGENRDKVVDVLLSMFAREAKRELTDEDRDVVRFYWSRTATSDAPFSRYMGLGSKAPQISQRKTDVETSVTNAVTERPVRRESYIHRMGVADIVIEVSDDRDARLDETRADVPSASFADEPLVPAFAADRLSENSYLSVSEILTLSLNMGNSPFVCCIACDSGVQDIGTGQEPLGLVSALLCAGASAVLGTLWPIRSDVGRLFSRHFYDHIETQIEQGPPLNAIGKKVLNLAQAVQYSTLQVKVEYEYPYNWAPFVLYGSPFYLYK